MNFVFEISRALKFNFHLILQCLLQINLAQILEPQCAFASGKPKEIEWDLRVQDSRTMNYLLSQTQLPELRCRVKHTSSFYIISNARNYIFINIAIPTNC
jgi:hypothetical protein